MYYNLNYGSIYNEIKSRNYDSKFKVPELSPLAQMPLSIQIFPDRLCQTALVFELLSRHSLAEGRKTAQDQRCANRGNSHIRRFNPIPIFPGIV